MSETRILAFEIGTEEIPAFDLERATKQLETLVPSILDDERVPHGSVTIYSTPRRLIVLVEDVASETQAIEEVFRGPSAKVAFDESGNPTKAAVGFARGKGLEVSDLTLREESGVEYVYATKRTDARKVIGLLPRVLERIIARIDWPKSCRWGTTHEVFSRPVRWLVALLGNEVIPVHFAGITADRFTYGHRVMSPGPHEVPEASELISIIEEAMVVPAQAAREAIIRKGVAQIEASMGCRAELPPKTLTEVINLTEYPTVLVGSFNKEFLRVPEEIIVDAMLMHQRYFPLYDEVGKLTNHFIVVSNGDPDYANLIISGNERVVAARLYDARFFYDEDLKQPLESYVARLDEVVFQERLGTMKAKTDRVVRLAAFVADHASLDDEEVSDVLRAAALAKADLVTNAVVEFTSVQGVMGSYYATASGENNRVAKAIADHYRPRFSGDDAPESRVGQVVAFADKLDTICGLFAVGQIPTGARDPFALRRAALGIITILLDGLSAALLPAIDASLAIYREMGLSFDRQVVATGVVDFFVARTKVLLRDSGNRVDTIDAVLSAGVREPLEIIKRVRALEAARIDASETFDDLATAFTRANNLRDREAGTAIDTSLFTDTERTLAEAVSFASAQVVPALQSGDYPGALRELAALRIPIDAFFREVMVMDDDPALRKNRMALLNNFVSVFEGVADFGLIAKK